MITSVMAAATTTTAGAGPNSHPPAATAAAAVSPDPTASKHDVGWRRIIRNFTPSWFAVSMGTGIVSILLHQMPYNGFWLRCISYIFFCINIALFTVFTAMSAARYTLYPEIWSAMVAHPAQSLFLGCFPMAFATIINMMALCCAGWGEGFVYFTWALWWVDALLSLAVCITMPFIVMSRHNPSLNSITAALLLPIVPAVVASASGGILAAIVPDKDRAFTTLVASYVLWGIGITFSACVLALYFQRLTIHSIPAREVIVSVFLPVGPMGQGGFAVQQLGKVAVTLVPETKSFDALGPDSARAGQILYVVGVLLGLVMWGSGLVWLAYALVSIVTTKSFPFNMGWWGFTFPLGVLAVCTGALGENLDSTFFRVSTVILSLSVLLLWIVVAFRTVYLVMTGEMFFAPCLKDLRPKERAAGSDRGV